MRRILYFTFYFEPDLCAGSFRNTPLVYELAKQLNEDDEITVITTYPNRYNTFKVSAPLFEKKANITIHRITIPEHKSGFTDQIFSFRTFYREAKKIAKKEHYDLVYASSSRLFSAFLGYRIARSRKLPLYLDIRDIFIDTMDDVLGNRLLKFFIMPELRWIERKVFSYATHINLVSAGFISYFNKYKKPAYSVFSNGVDDEFASLPSSPPSDRVIKKILYAGNIGEGQGLHIIIPQAARQLEGKYEFVVVGDGGTKNKLVEELERLQVKNVRLFAPVRRKELMEMYLDSDFLFIHLNNYEAFKKVLPSKVFEMAAYDKPVIAGVGGYAGEFVKEHVANSIVFEPGDCASLVEQLSHYTYRHEKRDDFIARFRRSRLIREMAASIASYLPPRS
ncbi:glycosyltransferase family 4 protein [Sediminibacterium roseum]|uniref:Glycosyltransferase family 4 protein n=1 Tax=Sediminibacterium roseum TaxID=1978412 RepID=A0ABW9ZSR9_9BACT|nr:glycosyltransferase family 4 protein [Sediminibacterium roseum]NCI49108.1 glycosyltransferase family 4 protein [Sediminibacterium roseum]